MNNIAHLPDPNSTADAAQPLLWKTPLSRVPAPNEAPMDDVELPELAGKQIVSAKISHPSIHEQELSLEFQDGTSFSFCCTTKITSEMSVYRGGVGEPEVIRKLAQD